jgi:hypothetical protein
MHDYSKFKVRVLDACFADLLKDLCLTIKSWIGSSRTQLGKEQRPPEPIPAQPSFMCERIGLS